MKIPILRSLYPRIRFVEDDLTLTAEETGLPDFLIPEPIQDDLINAVVGCRNGVAE